MKGRSIVFVMLVFCPLITLGQTMPLFRITEVPTAQSSVNRSSVAAKREAMVHFEAAGQLLSSADSLDIPLFDGKIHRASRRNIEVRAMDDLTWRGRIGDMDVVVTFYRGHVAGLIYSSAGVYEIIPRGQKHILIELDPSAFPECAGEIPSGYYEASANSPSATIDSGDRIDVLVVYTTATKNILGGDVQARAHAQQAIDATNTAYVNSRIRQRVRLVHAEEYLYTETSSASTDLSNLRANAGIQTLRNTHRADLVAMIGEMQGVCGIGYLMGAQGGNQNNGFTATARSCAVGNLSFAHELGHNMGSHHNPENGSNPTYPYGFGHYVNGSYRTVMSYVDPCTSSCARVAYFSNPNVIFNGQPTGIANARDNARSINNTADWIANYRYSGSNLMLTNWTGGDIFPRLMTRNVVWTSDNVTGNVRIDISFDEGQNWQILIASTANDGIEPITFGNRATKRARLRITSIDVPHVSDSSVTNVTIR